jgi:DNA-binding CsgD family transcriptional regulator
VEAGVERWRAPNGSLEQNTQLNLVGGMTQLSTPEEERLAVKLYGQLKSLRAVARRMGRSPSGIYKILRRANARIDSHTKLTPSLGEKIADLYYRVGLSSRAIAEYLKTRSDTSISKFTVLRALKDAPARIPPDLLKVVGTGRITFQGSDVDLLPFVSISFLRCVDDQTMVLKHDNSEKVIIKRFSGAADFGYLLGLYAAEGDKTVGPASTTF